MVRGKTENINEILTEPLGKDEQIVLTEKDNIAFSLQGIPKYEEGDIHFEEFVEIGQASQEDLPRRAENINNISINFEKDINFDLLYFPDESNLSVRIKAAISSGKHIILIGPPGTGKSKLAIQICKSYGVQWRMVTASAEWSTFDTIGGYKPEPDNTLIFQSGIFLECFKDRKTQNSLNKWLIIDEINRADIDKAFGGLFSVLTGDEVTLSNKTKDGENIILRAQRDGEDQISPAEHEYIVPRNWRLIATMNTFDKTSLYEMSYAFMRRFAFIPVEVPEKIEPKLLWEYSQKWKTSYDGEVAATRIEVEAKSGNVSRENVTEDSPILLNLATIWKLINRYRKIGPAIIQDILNYLSEMENDYLSAIVMYVLPQFESLSENQLKSFVEKLADLDFFTQKEVVRKTILGFFEIEDDTNGY